MSQMEHCILNASHHYIPPLQHSSFRGNEVYESFSAPAGALFTISCASLTITFRVRFVLEALRVDLVNVLHARGPAREPAVGRHDFRPNPYRTGHGPTFQISAAYSVAPSRVPIVSGQRSG
jgi:hypothetical protein